MSFDNQNFIKHLSTLVIKFHEQTVIIFISTYCILKNIFTFHDYYIL